MKTYSLILFLPILLSIKSSFGSNDTGSESVKTLSYRYEKNKMDPAPSAPICDQVNEYISCDEKTRYRTMTGKCNNLKFKWWGSSRSPYNRLLAPIYAGIETTVTHVNGHKLASADTISQTMPDINLLSGFSGYWIHFGQFLSHDLGNTFKGSEMCDCHSKNTECVIIPLENLKVDLRWNQGHSNRNHYGSKFMSKSRMMSDSMEGRPDCHTISRDVASIKVFPCKFGRREQLSNGNYFLDMDHVYGANNEQMNMVREYMYGRLKMSKIPGSNGLDSLPIMDRSMCTKPKDIPTKDCFFAADQRHSNIPTLNAIHVIFNRKHNQLVEKLHYINPTWTDEILFQEARRINIALYQNIIYKEYLPILLGPKVMKEFHLNPFESDYFKDYTDKIYPNTLNEFQTTAFRLHHLIHNSIELRNSNYDVKEKVDLKDLHFNQSIIYDKLEEIIHGATGQATNGKIYQMADGISKFLRTKPTNSGLNLPSINIQRGREHGFQQYIHYRKLAGQNYPRNFDELYDINPKVLNALRRVYRSVEDIDLYVGFKAELALDGGMIGRTGSYIVAREFFNKKYADRFYYETNNKVTGFTRRQLDEIRKYTFSKLICDTTQVEKAPKHGFNEYRNPDDPFYRPHSKKLNPRGNYYSSRKLSAKIKKNDVTFDKNSSDNEAQASRQKRDYSKLSKYMYEEDEPIRNVLAICEDIPDLDLSLWHVM